MKARRTSFFALGAIACSASLLTGCSDKAVDVGAAQGTSAPGFSEIASGSYDLAFQQVAVLDPTTGLASMQIPTSLSKGTLARIDLRKADHGYDAIVTPRWEAPAAFSVDVSNDSVTLEGSAVVGANVEYGESDAWTSITLARGTDGKLSGVGLAAGSWSFLVGDYGNGGALSARCTVAADATLPELKSAPSSPLGPPDVLLPWDPLPLSMAEGVDEASLTKAISLEVSEPGAAAKATPVSFQFLPKAADTAWGGAISAVGHASSWNDVVGASASLVVDAGVPNLAGHLSAKLTSSFAFLGMPAPAAAHDFDSDVVQVASWGNPIFLGGKAGSDPACEQGGCVELGPFDTVQCNAPLVRIGIAGRLIRPPQSHALHVRYRVLVAPNEGAADTPPQQGRAPLAIEIAVPGAVPVSTYVALPSVYQDLGAGAKLRWASDWLTADVDIPQGSEIGYALYASNDSTTCPGIDEGGSNYLAVFIDRVSID